MGDPPVSGCQSLLKLEQSRPGKSVAMKRKRAGWEPDYAFRVLSMISRV